MLTIYLYWSDLISDYQVTELFYNAKAYRFAFVSASLLVGQFMLLNLFLGILLSNFNLDPEEDAAAGKGPAPAAAGADALSEAGAIAELTDQLNDEEAARYSAAAPGTLSSMPCMPAGTPPSPPG